MLTPDSLDNLTASFAIPLTHYTVISVAGEQRDDYLHGQLTVNIKKLENNLARHAAHCDFKGKTWSLSTVCRWNDEILLSLPVGSAPQSLEQLKKYGVFSKVDIQDRAGDLSLFAVKGSEAESWIKRTFDSLPEQPLSTVQNDAGVVIRQDYPDGLFLLILKDSAAAAFNQFMTEQSLTVYSPEVFEALAIKNGVADVSGAVVNEFVPQMMNVQALDGIDFNKGCYMGQEVVARTRYLGRNKRAGYVFCIPHAVNVNVGDTVEKALENGWRRGGAVIRKAQLQNETWFMAVLPNDTEADTLHRLAESPEHQACFSALPYTIEQPSS